MRAGRLAVALAAAIAIARAEAPGPGGPLYLEENPAAERLLEEARRAEGEGRGPEAIEAWARLGSLHPEALCEVEPGLWRCAEEVASERLQALPADQAQLGQAARARSSGSPLESARRALGGGRPGEALRLLSRDPWGGPEETLLAARAALALGDDARATAIAERADGDPSPILLGDREMPLGEAVRALLARVAPPSAAAGWPIAPAIRDIPPIEGPLVCWKEIDLASPRREREADLRDRVLAAQTAAGGSPSFAPAVSDGVLVLRDLESLVAVDLADGKTRWTHRDSPVRCPVHLTSGRISGRPACSLWGPVVSGDRVFFAAESGNGRVRLRAVSLSDGSTLFDVAPPEGATLAAAPLPRGGMVYLVLATLGAEEQYRLVAVDASSGRVLWSSFLYALLGGPSHLFDWALGASSIGAIAEAGGTIFVSSNAGVVVAIDRTDGRVLWVRRYETVPASEARVAIDDGLLGWGANPVVVDGERLLVAPMDGEALLVLRRADGKLLGQVPRRGRRALLGVTGDLAYVAGSEVACVDLTTGEDRWRRPLEGRPFGRGFVTPTGVYHATDRALVCLRPEDGELVWGPCTWPAAGAGDGTLLPAGSGILCASGTRLTLAVPRRVYDRDWQGQLAGMASRLGRAPEEGDMLLARGEAYEKAGYQEEALADYLAVAAREPSHERARRARERSYGLLSGRAGRLEGEGRLQESLTAWREALDVAGDCAALARTRIAGLLDRTGDLAGALAAWQEVLERHATTVIEGEDVRLSGRALARSNIAGLRVRLGLPAEVSGRRPAPTSKLALPGRVSEAAAWDRLSERAPILADGGWPWADASGEPAGEAVEALSLLPVEGEVVVRRGRTVACLEADGPKVRWMSRLSTDGDPLVARQDDVVFLQEPRRLAALDLASGKLRWEAEPPAGDSLGGPWPRGGRVLVAVATPGGASLLGGGAVLLTCLGAADGSVVWETAVPGSTATRLEVTDEEVVLVDVATSRLTVVELGDGTERLTRSGKAFLAAGGPVDAWGLAGGCAVVLSGGVRLTAWDLATGELRWESRAPAKVQAFAASEAGIALALAGGRVIVHETTLGVHALDRTLDVEPSLAAWFGEVLAIAGDCQGQLAGGEGRSRIVRLRREEDGSFAEAPGVDLGEALPVASFYLMDGCAVVESPCGGAIDGAATLTAWQLGDSEVLWQQTFPLASGERLTWRLVRGALVEESHGVVRLFSPVEER